MTLFRTLGLCCALVLAWPTSDAVAQERLCDSAFENCHNPLRDLIRNEKQGIDVAFWFMTDMRWANELISRWKAGVPVRVLVDTRAVQPENGEALKRLSEAGIPMRRKTSSGILHWKMMLFSGQGVVEFSGANYSSSAFQPIDPYVNYVDEVIYFTNRSSIVNSFRTRFDDLWTTTSGFSNYANVNGGLHRHYSRFPIDPELNFVPWDSFRDRSVSSYNAEPVGIDAIIYRITDRAHTDALIEAIKRGVRVRILTEQKQYRDPMRLWHSWNVERLYMAGAEVRHRQHNGLVHEKLTLLRGQGMTIFGSSNWTGPSTNSQVEHNLFTKDPSFFAWSVSHFDRKWFNLGPAPETQPFEPLPPDRPSLRSPSNGATGQSGRVTLQWYAGPWAHKYDIYMGTDPANLVKLIDDHELGPSETSTDIVRWTVEGLQPSTTYYWYVVSRTIAGQTRSSALRSFTVGSSAPSTTTPLGWRSEGIGGSAPGSVSENGGRFTVSGGGDDIWGSSDEFRFIHRTLSGNGTIEARIVGLEGLPAGAKVGVMLRDKLDPASKHASMLLTADHGLAFQRRTSTGGDSAHTAAPGGGAPVWVRVTREGDQVSAYTSTNGVSWTHVGTATIPMGTVIRAGLVVSSPGGQAKVTFDNVSLTTNHPTPPTPSSDPGGPGPDPGSPDDEGPARTAIPRPGLEGTPDPLPTRRRSSSPSSDAPAGTDEPIDGGVPD